MRESVKATTTWASKVGYSRAVRVGSHVLVSGTTAVDANGGVPAPGDAYRQTIDALQKIEAALRELDCPLEAVVRTRAFVTDLDQWEGVARAHCEVFGEIEPASSMIGIAALLHPDLVVELEADAILEEVAR